MTINANAAEPKPIPHGVFRMPRRGFCCFGILWLGLALDLTDVVRLTRESGTESRLLVATG